MAAYSLDRDQLRSHELKLAGGPYGVLAPYLILAGDPQHRGALRAFRVQRIDERPQDAGDVACWMLEHDGPRRTHQGAYARRALQVGVQRPDDGAAGKPG